MMSDEDEAYIEDAKAYLGERFDNFAFCVLRSDGELFYDYSNWLVGKALLKESLEDLDRDHSDGEDFEWADVEDDDEDLEYE